MARPSPRLAPLSIGGAAACLGIAVLARIAAEERLLAATFGADYAAWRARTARLLAGLWCGARGG